MINIPRFGAVDGAVYSFDPDHFPRSCAAFDEAVYRDDPSEPLNYRALGAKIMSNTLHEIGMTGGMLSEALG